MSDSVSEFAVNRNNENIKLIPKLLNKEETLLLAEKDFGRQSDFGADQIKEFVNDHVKKLLFQGKIRFHFDTVISGIETIRCGDSK